MEDALERLRVEREAITIVGTRPWRWPPGRFDCTVEGAPASRQQANGWVVFLTTDREDLTYRIGPDGRLLLCGERRPRPQTGSRQP